MGRRVWPLFLIVGLLIACVSPGNASAKEADCSGVEQQDVSHEIHQIQGTGTSSPLEGIRDHLRDGDRHIGSGILDAEYDR